MKKTLASVMLLMAAAMLSCCSDDDNNSPQPEPIQKYQSLVTEFHEAYGFRSLDTECDMEVPAAQRKVMVPVEGVIAYEATDFNANLDGKAPKVKVNSGKSITFNNNPHNFNKLLEKYGDTQYEGNDEDISTYRPHPYAITGITMRMTDEFSSSPTIIYNHEERTPDYSSKYRMGHDCTSLFKIRYRTYADYISNGYSWEGLKSNSPWKEMELTEFNRLGGDKLIDMTRFYLIVKEVPDWDFSALGFAWPMVMTVNFENGKTNVHNRELKMEMMVVHSMFK